MSTHPNIVHSPANLGGVVQFDREATKKTLGIMPEDLPADSHTRVIVFCTHCGEQFQREYRNINLPHDCPRFLIRNGEKQQKCAVCGKYYSIDSLEDSVCTFCDVEEDDIAVNVETPVRLECRFIDGSAKLPHRKRTTDVGHDLYSVVDTVIEAHSTGRVGTGIQLSAPEGYFYTIEGRSGLFLKGITPFRGIIDATYCGEVIVILMNASGDDFVVNKGDRIGQIILQKAYNFDVTMVKEFGPDYDLRGEAGWGSSGR